MWQLKKVSITRFLFILNLRILRQISKTYYLKSPVIFLHYILVSKNHEAGGRVAIISRLSGPEELQTRRREGVHGNLPRAGE